MISRRRMEKRRHVREGIMHVNDLHFVPSVAIQHGGGDTPPAVRVTRERNAQTTRIKVQIVNAERALESQPIVVLLLQNDATIFRAGKGHSQHKNSARLSESR